MSYRDEIKKRPGSQLLPWQVFDALGRADARIAELEREIERLDAQWRDELRIYRETENERIAELESEVLRLKAKINATLDAIKENTSRSAAKRVFAAVKAFDAARANGGEG